jgi:hypothetical protein
MTAGEFYEKWNINISTVSYYKKRFPQFVFNNNLDYGLLNQEFERRIKIKEDAKMLLSSATSTDIKDCELFKNSKKPETNACHWLLRLYLPYLNEKINRHLITDVAIKNIQTIVEHYKRNFNDKKDK